MDPKFPDPQQVLDLKLLDLLTQCPSAAQTLIDYRMACVGCDFAGFHSARQAIGAYRLDETSFLRSLQAQIASSLDNCSSEPPPGFS